MRSVVGRFLEHSRVYYFENAGAEDVYLASADWMARNFFRRIELCFPVLDATLKKRVIRATGKKLSAAEALALARRKPRLARATQPVIEHLTAAVVAITALLDPEAIIFGGGTSEAGAALLSRVRKEVRKCLETQPRLMPAKLRGDAQLYGALWGAIHASRTTSSFRDRGMPSGDVVA